MRFGITRWTLAVAAILVLPPAVEAQGPAQETLVTGRRSIQVGGLTDGASLGFWKMRNANTNLGIVLDASVGFNHSENEDSDEELNRQSFDIAVGPELRRYTAIDGRVAPYGFVGGDVRFGWDRLDDGTDSFSEWSAGLGARVGLGAEFFPAASLSIGGQMGVGAGVGFDPSSDDDPNSNWGVEIGTFGASLMAAIYF